MAVSCCTRATWRDTIIPLALLVVVNMIFSGYVVLAAAAFKGSSLSPIVFAFLRDIVASLILMPACYYSETRKPAHLQQFWPRNEDWGRFFLLGMLGTWGAQLMSSLTISFLSASIYGLLTPSVPIVTALVSFALGVDIFYVRSAASWTKVLGILVTVGGAVALVGFSSTISLESKNASLGTMYLVFQKLSAGTYPILQKKMLREGYPSLTLTAWAYVLGTVLIGMCVLTSAVDASDWSFAPVAAGSILYSGILSSAFNYGCMAYVNGKTSPVVVMSFYPLQSIMVPVLSTLFLGTDFHASDAITGAVIVAGLGILITGRYMESSVTPGSETATPLLPSGATASAPDGASGSTSRGEQTSLIGAVAMSGGYNGAAVAGGGAAAEVQLSTFTPGGGGGSGGIGAQPGAGGASEWGATATGSVGAAAGSRAGGARGGGPRM